ncbi:MAG TPA: pilus assembly protein PilV [Gammaproteobacteria bacterium]|nr:pilus assembly protein PilV [Gammaproteobacteria bacterium]
MQLTTLRNAEESYQQSLAVVQLAAMSDRLRANHAVTARDRELISWNVINARLLPKGVGSYHCNNNTCKVTLKWEFGKLQQASLSLRIGEY